MSLLGFLGETSGMNADPGSGLEPRPGRLSSGDRFRPVVAITIDAEHPDRAGHGGGVCERLLATLSESRVAATFFLQGRWASANPGLARSIASAGHLVGSHSQYHAPMTLLTAEGLADDVLQAECCITSVTGCNPRPWFRSPFGTGLHDESIDRRLAALGYVNVPWDSDGGDWEEGRSKEEVADQILSGVELADGSAQVVLLHSWPEAAAGALPVILAHLAEVGTRFVTVDALARTFPTAVSVLGWEGMPRPGLARRVTRAPTDRVS
jgi:peptidoglycan/xylan/chitin deacetylase (PgdA/CDA1 family)